MLRRVATVGRGEDPFSVPHVVEGVADDAWGALAGAAAHEVQAVWADPAVLSRRLRLPFGTLPGAAALATYTGEVTTHTWDLAVATGQSPAWDGEVLALALASARRALPADGRGPGVPFAPVVPVPEEASLIEQLAGWQGRDPRWTRPADPAIPRS